MRKMNWVCENAIPFGWKYWMTLHALWIELKFNSIQFIPNSIGVEFLKGPSKIKWTQKVHAFSFTLHHAYKTKKVGSKKKYYFFIITKPLECMIIIFQKLFE
jgi:hypothetical protein